MGCVLSEAQFPSLVPSSFLKREPGELMQENFSTGSIFINLFSEKHMLEAAPFKAKKLGVNNLRKNFKLVPH